MNEMIANWRIRGRFKGKKGGLLHGFCEGKPVFGGAINAIYAPIWWGKTHSEALEILERIKLKCESLEVELELERCS